MNRTLAVWALAGACAFAAGGALAVSAIDIVGRFQSTLIQVMRDGPGMGFEGRRRQLGPVVREVFDFPAITRLVIGEHWDSLDEGQRTAVRDRLERLALATLAGRFRRHDGETFTAESEKMLPSGQYRIRSAFRPTGGQPVAVDYTVRQDGKSWRIVNVWFNGVSGTAIHRQEFDALLRREGFAATLTRLDDKIAEYAAAPE